MTTTNSQGPEKSALVDVNAAIDRAKQPWNPVASHVDNEAAYRDRFILAAEVLILRQELADTEDAQHEAEEEVARLIGVIKAEQTDNGDKIRNDRLIAIASQSRDQQNVRSIEQLDAYLIQEIEHFFISYHELDGEAFRPIACLGPGKAKKIVDKGLVGKQRTSTAGAKVKHPAKS